MSLTPYLDNLSVANPFVVEPEPSWGAIVKLEREACWSAGDRLQRVCKEYARLFAVKTSYRNRMSYDLGGDCE